MPGRIPCLFRRRTKEVIGAFSVNWAVAQIASFLNREQSLCLDMAKVLVPGEAAYASLPARSGLIDRVTRFDPTPIPP
jgi:hypothetical protein